MPLTSIEQDYRTEVARKTIHLTGFVIPWIYYYVDRTFAVAVLIPFTLLALVIDFGRRGDGAFARWFGTWLGPILREKEKGDQRTLHALTWFFIVSTVMVAFTPRYVAILSISIMLLADAAAALLGRRYGRHKVGGRSLEGCAAFFLAGMVIVAVTPRLSGHPGEWAVCALAALVGAVVELVSQDPLEDNVTVPLSIGLTLWLGYALAFPGLDLNAYGAGR
jgi:dolichol kinase